MLSTCRGFATLLPPTLIKLPLTQVQRFRLAEM